MFTIKIVDKHSGRPASNVKVDVCRSGWTGGFLGQQWTDDDGEVHFDYDPMRGSVYVDGSDYGERYFEGRTVIYT